jgi:hypothetical protein
VRRGVKGNESPLKTGCHVEAVSGLGRAALHVLPSEAVHQPVTRRPKWRKKSTPRMGNWTAAKRKGQLKTLPLKDS